MWELDYKEGWTLKTWYFWVVVLEKTLESPLDCKKIKPINPKGNQPWILTGRTDAQAEIPILWPPDANSPAQLCCWERLKAEGKGSTEDEMTGCHHWLNGHEFEQALRDDEGQGSLICFSPWVTKNWTQLSEWIKPTRIILEVYESLIFSRWGWITGTVF